MVTKMETELGRALQIYAQQVRNLDDPEDVMTEVLLVLATRDSFVKDGPLTDDQLRQLDRVDAELVKRWKVVGEALPAPHAPADRQHWWWFLHEGPQVREQAKALAAAD